MRVSNDLSQVLSGGRLTWSGSPTLDRSSQRNHSRRKSSLSDDDQEDEGFGDDFDDFEEGAQVGEDDDFGDFDDGFEEPSAVKEVSEPPAVQRDEHRTTFVSRQCSNASRCTLSRRSLSFILMLIL